MSFRFQRLCSTNITKLQNEPKPPLKNKVDRFVYSVREEKEVTPYFV